MMAAISILKRASAPESGRRNRGGVAGGGLAGVRRGGRNAAYARGVASAIERIKGVLARETIPSLKKAPRRKAYQLMKKYGLSKAVKMHRHRGRRKQAMWHGSVRIGGNREASAHLASRNDAAAARRNGRHLASAFCEEMAAKTITG